MVNPVLDAFHMSVEHRCICLQAGTVNLSREVEPPIAVRLMRADLFPGLACENLCTAAGTRVHSSCFQFFNDLFVCHLVKAPEIVDLDHCKGLQMHLGKLALQGR